MTEVLPSSLLGIQSKSPGSYQAHITDRDNVDGNHKNYFQEQVRLESFKDWNVPFINKEDLAKSGFYYMQIGDLVKCTFCGVEIGNWEEGDVPAADHKKWSPGCPFLKGRVSTNVPVNVTTNGAISTDGTINRGVDVCGRYEIERRPNSYADNDKHIKYRLDRSLINPKYPHYASIECRKQSYGFWPISLKQKPNELADAGFFYTGQGDRTMCFFCGLGLNLWQDDDVPWEQHARWSPKCAYLLNKKSPKFVEDMTEKFRDIDIVPATSSTVTEEKVVPSIKSTEEPTKENEKTMCKICYSKEIGIVFMPCGHLVACVDCASALTSCPMCRQKLNGTIRAYLS